MGFVSRNVFPACANMCICCPALRSRSRQPLKRYKKLLAQIFPKSADGSPNDRTRSIQKLCEYAAKNPWRIPKIANYLEERCHKELRSEHLAYINTVVEVYNKLLSCCKEQIAYFAVSLLNTVSELVENPKYDKLRILGCQTLTRFIHSQADTTYAHSIEMFVHKVCGLAGKAGGDQHTSCLRAYSLQCLSSMVWFMAEYSVIFDDFDEIVFTVLDNYEPFPLAENDNQDAPHNWINEVVRCEGRAGANASDNISSFVVIRHKPVEWDPDSLTRDEMESPQVWAQICIQRMVGLAEERTTIRRILDPMFIYFDSKGQWVPQKGLALVILSEFTCLIEGTGSKLFTLASVVRHLDHNNVANDPKKKSLIIQVAAALVRVIRSEGIPMSEVGCISDLCKHLRKCLQATIKSVEDEEISLNISLQSSIEDCLLEFAKGIAEVQPLFDIMAIMLERLLTLEDDVVAKASIGCLLAIAHMITLSPPFSKTQQGFPDAFFVHLLKVMTHSNVETRIGAHRIFVVLLTANCNHWRAAASLSCGLHLEQRNWPTDSAAAVHCSVATLLEKLRKEKDGDQAENHVCDAVDICKHKNTVNVEEKKQEPYMLKLTEDQVTQLLSSFWIQASLPDNLPSNIEAICQSFSLTLISLGFQDLNDNLVVRFFQLPLSMRTMALDSSSGTLPPACRRSIFVLSTAMLLFAAKIFHVIDQTEMTKLQLPCDMDPYLGISDDFQVYLKPRTGGTVHYSLADNEEAVTVLTDLKQKIVESNNTIHDIISRGLSCITKLETEDIARQLSEIFTPDDSYMLDEQMGLDWGHNHRATESKESLSFDGDASANVLVEDGAVSVCESAVSDMSRFIPIIPASPAISQIISVRQLLDSALEVAGQVTGTTASTSSIPYSAMTRQCEALGIGNRKKLTNWLVYDDRFSKSSDYPRRELPALEHFEVVNINNHYGCTTMTNQLAADPWLAIKLPPASPFDNFLRAAQYNNGSHMELSISDR